MARTIDELLIGLGFDYDPSDLESYDKGLKKTNELVKQYTAVILAGTAALLGFVSATTAASDRQGKLSNETGVAVERIDALEFALARAGGQGDSLGSSLEQLSVRIGEASRGMGTGVEAFGLLGISVTDVSGRLKTADEIMLEVADRFQGLDRVQQIELAEKLGLRDSILLLQEGRAGIEALTAEAQALGVTTGEDAALAAEFQDSLVDIFRIVKQLARVITRSLAPVFQRLADVTTEWWKQNREIIEQNLPRFVERAAQALSILLAVMGGILAARLPAYLLSLISLFKKISLIPLVVGALIAAFALLIDDAAGFFAGQESFIGDMIKKYPQWEEQIVAVAAVFNAIAETIKLIIKGMEEIFNLFTGTDFIADFNIALEQLGKDIKSFFTDLGADIKGFFSGLVDDSIGGALDFFGIGGDQASISSDAAGGVSASSRLDIAIGDINVSAGEGADGRVIGEQVSSAILESLEPVLQQTSKDLNSVVVA